VHFALLDTCIYIDFWEGALAPALIDTFRKSFVVRYSAVVLSELRRGARTNAARALVTSLARVAAEPWAPAADDWWEAGALIQKIGDAARWETSKRREFQNDALIALTARRHGATVVTTNAADFERLERRVKFSLLVL
jgi:predicted nucleic acid-binding protein